MATKGLLNKLGTVMGEQVSDARSFTYANSAAQYTVKKLEFDFSDINKDYKRRYHMVSVFNESTECDLTARVFGEINHGGFKRLVQLDSFTASKMGATVAADKVYYYDKSGDTYADDQADFDSAGANDVAMPGHAAGEVDDFLMIGHTLSPFNQILLNVGTANTDVRTLVFEYSKTATTWTEFDDADTDFDQTIFDSTGVKRINFNIPDDWALVDPAAGAGGGANPDAAWYVRIRCSAFDHAHTAPILTQGKIVKSAVYGAATTIDIEDSLGIEYDRIIVTLENAGAAASAAKATSGVGGFTGYVAITAI